jgi:hypothetical protein
MEMDMDRFDAEPYQSSDFDELDSLDSYLDHHAGEQNEMTPLLDDDNADPDEHDADFGLYNIDVSEIVEEIWLDSAPPMHFSIEAGYF